jgi:pimeloyl-ACP methyl ester carboxylesterase
MWSFMYPTSATAEPSGEKPTIVLVHGAWADTSSWNGEVDELQQAGYVVRAIANPLENLTTDSDHVANFLRTVDGRIVLVGHSYGGSVITNAAEGTPTSRHLYTSTPPRLMSVRPTAHSAVPTRC